ncbi:MAG: AAA family ATPase [Verrucomicrobiales bacterium]|nr:AAA family ATPase [Verrucomicrobiales bacterium]
MPTPFDPPLHRVIELPEQDSWPFAYHRFDQESVWAVQTALAIRRPLLLRGEPGIGKSQLARAVAKELRVPFLYHVVDERSERDDLMHAYDAVARLAEAQVSSLAARQDSDDWRERLVERNFVRPGVLWWAFDWASARKQAEDFHARLRRSWRPPVIPDGWKPDADRACGPVVLLDEIDKADPSVPNGLLECLGNEGFQTAQLGEAVRLPKGAKPPLVIITTNEERELPSAFLRRCLVLHMQFPKDKDAAIGFLEQRATRLVEELRLSPEVCRAVAECIVADRAEARGRSALPGASEFLELLRALAAYHPDDPKAQKERLKQIAGFALRKHDSFS